jgi:hypothetical protein
MGGKCCRIFGGGSERDEKSQSLTVHTNDPKSGYAEGGGLMVPTLTFTTETERLAYDLETYLNGRASQRVSAKSSPAHPLG